MSMDSTKPELQTLLSTAQKFSAHNVITEELKEENESNTDDKYATTQHLHVSASKYDPSKLCEIAIKSVYHNKYISIQKNGEVQCSVDDENITKTAWFLSIPISQNKIGIKSLTHHNFLTAQNGDTIQCLTGRTSFNGFRMINGKWDQTEFTVIDRKNGKYALQTYRSTYLSVQESNGAVQSNVKATSELEEFEIYTKTAEHLSYDPSKRCLITLFAANHRYVRAYAPSNNQLGAHWMEPHQINQIKSDSLWAGTWQIYESIPTVNKLNEADSKIYICSNHRTYISVCNDTIKCENDRSQRSQFEPIPRNGKYALKTYDNKFVSVEMQKEKSDYKLTLINCDENKLSENEQFEIEVAHQLRWYSVVWVNHFGNTDIHNQSFRINAEIWTHRELLHCELEEWIKNPKDFQPQVKMEVHPDNFYEIIQLDEWTFGNTKDFVIYWMDALNCYMLKRCYSLSADFIEPMELDNFPFDTQHFEFPIMYRVGAAIFDVINGKQIKTILNEAQSESRFYNKAETKSAIVGWDFIGIQLGVECFGRFCGEFKHLHRVILRRSWSFYIRKIVVILAIVSLLSIFVFVYDTGDPLGFVSTMFLTAVAYLYIINDHLPVLQKQTLLDRYANTTLGFIGFIGVSVCIFNNDRLVDNDKYYNDTLLLVWFGVWCLIQIIFSGSFYKALKIENAKIYQSKETIDSGTVSERMAKSLLLIGPRTKVTKYDEYPTKTEYAEDYKIQK
eukprot:549895_1